MAPNPGFPFYIALATQAQLRSVTSRPLIGRAALSLVPLIREASIKGEGRANVFRIARVVTPSVAASASSSCLAVAKEAK